MISCRKKFFITPTSSFVMIRRWYQPIHFLNSTRSFHFSSSSSNNSNNNDTSTNLSSNRRNVSKNFNFSSTTTSSNTYISQDELAMMDVEELTRELGRFGWHSPKPAHLQLVVNELLSRGTIISAKTIREAVKLCYLSQDRKILYPLAIELFVNRTYGATENDMKMLGLPEELVDCAALSEVGDPLQKLILVCRTCEHTLRTAHSVDVVSGLEMALFRALWRCFVILKHLRFSGTLSRASSSTSSNSSSSSSGGEELEVLEAARRIFDLLTIVNKKIISLLLLLGSSSISSSSLLTASSLTKQTSSSSSTSMDFTSADENLAFKTLCRFISLRVMYSSSSSSSMTNSSSNINSSTITGGDYDDAEAEYFRLVFTRNWLQADVSGGPAARYLSLMKTCEIGMRHDIATEYFEQYEINHPFLVKKMQGFTDSSSSTSETTNKSEQSEQQEEEKLFLSFQVEQFELVLKSYWNLLASCGEHKKVIQILVKYLDIFDKYNHQLPASLLSVAMRSVGEVKNSQVAARTMGNLFRSFSSKNASSTKTSVTATTASDSNNHNNHSSVDSSSSSSSSTSTSVSTSGNFRPPTQYEMLTCLSSLAKCGHPSFHQALETCIQENLIDASSASAPLRIAELRLMYALNDPIDALTLVQAEITRCENAGCSIKSDFRCSGLILQILLRVDDDSFLNVFQDIVIMEEINTTNEEDDIAKKNKNKRNTLLNNTGGISDVPSAWVDWLVVWSLRRRYELTQADRAYILSVIDRKKAPSHSVAPQAEIIRFDFDQHNKRKGETTKTDNGNENDEARASIMAFSDPRCVWPKRRTALTNLVLHHRQRQGLSAIAESSGGCVLIDKLMMQNNQQQQSTTAKLQSLGDATLMLKRLGEF